MEFDFTFPLSDMTAAGCARCRKPFVDGETMVIIHRAPKGPRKPFLESGDTLFALQVYHDKCIPPVWFHRNKVAGSLPVGQSVAQDVPQ